jgi:hypothetical protein
MNTELNRISNPFASSASAGNAMTEVTQSREIAEIQAAMVIAKKFPRDPIAAMDRILNACTRPSLAESALYSYNRGGTEVTGPSIRLAEAIAQNWGNIQFGIRELEQTQSDSTVEAFAFDLETNTRQVKVFQVPHIRFTKAGKKKLDDPRDIYELVANQGARRLRACILGVIPGDVVEAARDQCEVTLQAHSEATPETIKKMVEAFATYKVTPEQIQKRLGRRLDSINAANIVQLKKIYQSLKDGMSKPEDWFEQTTPGVADINERLTGKKAETVDKVTGEILPADDVERATTSPSDSQGPLHADWLAAIDACTTVADIARLMKEMPGHVKKALATDLRQRQDQIKGAKA